MHDCSFLPVLLDHRGIAAHGNGDCQGIKRGRSEASAKKIGPMGSAGYNSPCPAASGLTLRFVVNRDRHMALYEAIL